MRIHPIHHSALVIEWHKLVVYVDPHGSADRFKDFPAPDLILITDIHGDHMNVPTLLKVVGTGTELVAPQAVIDQLPEPLKSRAKPLANGASLELDGITVNAIPMYNLPEAADSRLRTEVTPHAMSTLDDAPVARAADMVDNRGSSTPWIAAAAILLILGGVAGWWYMRGPSGGSGTASTAQPADGTAPSKGEAPEPAKAGTEVAAAEAAAVPSAA